MPKAARTREKRGENSVEGAGFAKIYLSGPVGAPVWGDSPPF